MVRRTSFRKKSAKRTKGYMVPYKVPYNVAKTMRVPAQAETTIQYVRIVVDINADSAGNISINQTAGGFLSAPQAIKNSTVWRECRPVALTACFMPSQYLVTQNTNQCLMWMSAYHGNNLSGVNLAGIRNMPQARYYTLVDAAPKYVKWQAEPWTAEEVTFQPTENSPDFNSLGGIVIYSDGPAASFNSYVGSVVFTYKLLYRGIRST